MDTVQPELKEAYVDSHGGVHNIDVMARSMVFNTVTKYGKQSLIDQGYSKLVDRFNELIKKYDVMKIITVDESQNETEGN